MAADLTLLLCRAIGSANIILVLLSFVIIINCFSIFYGMLITEN